MASVSGWGRPGRLRQGVRDDVPVAHWVVADRQLQHAKEQQTATAGRAPVESETELVQVAVQVRGADRTLVGGEKPAFGQRGDTVDAGQQVPDIRLFRMQGVVGVAL